MLEKKFDYSSLGGYIELVHNNTFEFDLMSLVKKIRGFYHDVISSESTVAEKAVQDYLHENSHEFEKLATEFIKKISQDS